MYALGRCIHKKRVFDRKLPKHRPHYSRSYQPVLARNLHNASSPLESNKYCSGNMLGGLTDLITKVYSEVTELAASSSLANCSHQTDSTSSDLQQSTSRKPKPPRKRKRTEDVESPRHHVSEDADVVRDKHYYFEDADCVIRVENTLLRVSTSTHFV